MWCFLCVCVFLYQKHERCVNLVLIRLFCYGLWASVAVSAFIWLCHSFFMWEIRIHRQKYSSWVAQTSEIWIRLLWWIAQWMRYASRNIFLFAPCCVCVCVSQNRWAWSRHDGCRVWVDAPFVSQWLRTNTISSNHSIYISSNEQKIYFCCCRSSFSLSSFWSDSWLLMLHGCYAFVNMRERVSNNIDDIAFDSSTGLNTICLIIIIIKSHWQWRWRFGRKALLPFFSLSFCWQYDRLRRNVSTSKRIAEHYMNDAY